MIARPRWAVRLSGAGRVAGSTALWDDGTDQQEGPAERQAEQEQ